MRHNEWSAVITKADERLALLAALLFAGVTAVCSKIYLHLWFTPVPVTLQVFAVILSGLVLGKRWGAVSQVQYLALGMAGLPVFAGPLAGPAAFASPSGGYLFGFVAGAYAAGWVFERLEGRTRFAACAAGVAGMIGVYSFGASWLGLWLGVYSGMPWNQYLVKAWCLGVQPFILVDLLKVMTAAVLVTGGYLNRGWLGSLRRFGW